MFDEIQKYKREYYRFDIDSSPNVYTLYEKIYSNSVKNKYCVSDPKFFRFVSLSKGYVDAPDVASINRLFALPVCTPATGNIIIQSRTYEIYDAVERLSGDCFFNFNKTKINNLKEIHGIDIKKLEKCADMHHSIYNMVLLQTMGNMQKRKQQGLKLSNGKYEQLDRGDTFLYLLNQYYENENEEILKASTKANMKNLRDYLLGFESVYDYSKTMLQIDDNCFINKITHNGGLKLDDTCVNNYLEIALQFWNKRKEKIDPIIYDLF